MEKYRSWVRIHPGDMDVTWINVVAALKETQEVS